MAFDQDNFAPVGAISTASPSVYSYLTADNSSVVTAANYFDDKSFQLNTDDIILAQMGDGFATLAVTSSGTASDVSADPSSLATSTGLSFGGTLSINADDTKFDVAAGSGVIVDYSDPQNPARTAVSWDAFSAVALDNPSDNLTYIGIDSAGAVHQQDTQFTEEDRRTYIRLGAATHITGSTISNISTVPVTAYDTNATMVDFVNAAGVRNSSGNVFSAGTLLAIDKTVGEFLRYAGNYVAAPENPNVVPSAASTGGFFLRMYRDGAGGWTTDVQTSLDPENYDDDSGTLATVTENFWQVFHVWSGAAVGSDFTLVQQGQVLYPNKDAAQLSLNIQAIETNPSLVSACKRSAIVVKQGTTDLSNAFFYEYDPAGIVALSPTANVATPLNRSYAFQSSGIPAGTHYLAGFYEAPAADANLTQASTTVTQGNAAEGHASHAFIVFGAASAATGTIQIVVSGNSITDAGVLTTSDTETLSVDMESLTLNDYLETPKKWVGTVTWTISLASGSGNFSADFNYGLAKYEDFGNRNFTITDIECVGQGNANDSAFDVQLLKHQATGWTYHATAFVPGSASIVDMQTDYGASAGVRNNQDFAYKRSGLSIAVGGNNGEGCLIRIVTGASGTVQIMSTHLTVEV